MRLACSSLRSLRLAGVLAIIVVLMSSGLVPLLPAVHAAGGLRAHQPVTLTFGVEFTDAPTTQAAETYLIKPFEKQYPWIHINLVQQSGASGIDHYLKTSLEAGSGPDVFDENGPSWMAPFADAHAVLNLDPYAKEYGWDKKILPFAYKAGLYHGHLYSLPTETETLVLWYNKTIFNKYHWSPPTTFDQMVTLSKAIQSKGLIPFAFGSSDCKPCWEWWESYALNAYVGPQMMYKVLTGKVPWTSPLVAQAFTKLKTLWDDGFINSKESASLSTNDSWGLFGAQKAVMKMEGTWGFGPGLIFNYAKGFNWSVATLPTWRSGVPAWPPVGVGEVDAINAHTKHPQEAALFLNWFFHSPSFNGQWAYTLSSVWVPPLKYTAADFPKATNPLFRQVLLNNEQAMASGKAGYLAWSAWPAGTEQYMWSNAESVLYGALSIPKFLQGMQKTFQGEQASGSLPNVPPPAS